MSEAINNGGPARHTQGVAEVVGATHVVIFGEHGGNICTVSSPHKSSAIDYVPVSIGDPDFKEACANAKRIQTAWNCHDNLLAAIEGAMRIVDLWCPALPTSRQHEHEYEALHSMRQMFRAAIQKARGQA